MEDLTEEEITHFVQKVLSKKDTAHPFSSNYIGLAETDILEKLHSRLSKRFIESQVNDIFQDVRKDIVARKHSITLQELHTVTRNCTKCEISSTAELPKWNVENPDIVAVIETPNMSPEGVSIMIEAFKNAGIQSQQLCLTYINRCPVQRKYGEQEILNCSPYLHTEIQLLNPKLVVCFGALPATVIFGTQMKIKEHRGNIIWLGHWPIMITYSPMYVARSTDDTSNSLQQLQQDLTQAKQFITKMQNDN